MIFEVKYGENQVLKLDLAPDALVADWSQAPGESLADPAAAVAASVNEPLEFPPLHQSLAPSDRIVLAVDREVPRVAAVVAGVVHSILQGGVPPDNICILHVDSDEAPVAELPADVRDRVATDRHDPSNRMHLAYLAGNNAGEPIYLNRHLIDADVVIPIGVLRSPEALAYSGVHGGLFPTFADDETHRRFQATSAEQSRSTRQQRSAEAQEAAWLLGVQFCVQVIAGSHGGVLHVLSGHSLAVERQGRRLVDAAWRKRASRLADFVVAAIEGGPEQQTWGNFARALDAAARVAEPDAVIVLCTNLKLQPGPALQRLSGRDFDEYAGVLEEDELAPDLLPASMLAELSGRNSVFLLSQLDEEVVEDLGLGYVTKAEEIERLSRPFQSCILLGNAHHAAPMTEHEDVESL